MSAVIVNHRLHTRRKLYYYLEVIDKNSKIEVGRLVDIHVAGMLLIGTRRLDSGLKLDIRVLIDDDLLETKYGNLDVQVLVRWSKQDINPDYYVTGVQFVEITPEQEELINELIRTIGFRE
ncbi:MAG TPA: PilZ domain-containing protein [Desulfonatronum sp.]|nr:PilZ domain-containing protein [Desulfonatronum sp.]